MEAEAGVRMGKKRARARGGVEEEEVGMWEGGMRWGDGNDENGKEGQRMGWVPGWG